MNAFFTLDDPDETIGICVWSISAGNPVKSPGRSLNWL